MADRPEAGTICTGDEISLPVRYEFFAPPDWWINDAVLGMFVNLVFPSRFTECGTITCDEAAAAFSGILDSVKRSKILIGSVIAYATEVPPDGALVCDGATYLGSDYPSLFAVIADEFKNGSNFSVPDLRGRVIMGIGPGFAFSADVGQQNATITIDSMPSHDHSIDHYFTALALAPGELPVLIPDPFSTVTGLTGGDQEHNNLQPSLVLNYCIIAEG